MKITDVVVQVHLCVPDDQKRYLPRQLRAPDLLPTNVPRPSVGEVVFLGPESAWGVQLITHEWVSPMLLRQEIWLDHIGSSASARPSGFAVTQ